LVTSKHDIQQVSDHLYWLGFVDNAKSTLRD
ncbi:MAG: hypothetical protein ACI87E_001484, partial [Mariniblastus sp.]